MKSPRKNIVKKILLLWVYISKIRRKEFYRLIVLIIFASIFEVISIGSLIPMLTVMINPELLNFNRFISYFIPYKEIGHANLQLVMVCIFCLLIIIAAIFRVFLIRKISRFSLNVCSDVCVDIYRKSINQPYIIQISRNSSDVIHAILSQTNSLIYEITLPVLNIISSFVMGLIILTFLIIYSPLFAFSILIIFSFVYFFIGYFIKRQLSVNSIIVNQQLNKHLRIVQESLGSIRDILLDNSHAVYLKKFEKSNSTLRKIQAKMAFIGSSPRYVIEAFGMVVIAIFMVFFQINGGTDSIVILPMLGGFALAFQRLLPIFQQAFASWVAIKSGTSSLDSILDLLAQPYILNSQGSAKLNFKKDIVLKGIAFKYQPENSLILKNVDLVIPKGARIGIIGSTGSGKSTLLDILMGLLEPTEGDILIDGVPIDRNNLIMWQQNISHVPQSIFLTDGTISENIAFGVPKKSIDQKLVIDCAKKAQIDMLIDGWVEGYDTNIGERGIKLSGGQKQRIGIARAIYKSSEVIIFDEATSSLDTETEKNVMKSIDDLDQLLTVIIVAHRTSTLINCDKIYKIIDGSLVEINKSEITQ
jgi:ABC-type multidrug transport system fused ATPase/permease subunit